MAMKRLMKEYNEIIDNPNYLYSVFPDENNFFKWNFMMIGPSNTLYENGIFYGHILFTNTYPINPPKVYFNNIIHPNIYKSGEVCISILHSGTDIYGYEKDYERWTPSLSVDSIMMSIISLFSDPNFESPANTDYSILWKDKPLEYKKLIYTLVAESH
jgi:ubiquitin-protein ligase